MRKKGRKKRRRREGDKVRRILRGEQGRERRKSMIQSIRRGVSKSIRSILNVSRIKNLSMISSF